jgi:hypothetical protein
VLPIDTRKTRWLATSLNVPPRGTNISMSSKDARMGRRVSYGLACVGMMIIYLTKTRGDVLTLRPGITAPRKKTS